MDLDRRPLNPDRQCGRCKRSRADGAVIYRAQSYCTACASEYKREWAATKKKLANALKEKYRRER